MNLVVHTLPGYYYNGQKRLYEKWNFYNYYQSESEPKLIQEIQSIKRLVPI